MYQKRKISSGESGILYTEPPYHQHDLYSSWIKPIPDQHPLNSNNYCTLESSSSTAIASTLSSSPKESPTDSQTYPSEQTTNQSPENESCVTDGVDDLKLMLRQLETAMFSSDTETLATETLAAETLDANYIRQEADSDSDSPEKWNQIMRLICDGDLKELLIGCARAIADNDRLTVEWLMSELRKKVSVSGEPFQRLGAYLMEGLVARLSHTGGSIYKALKCKEPTSPELFSYMQLLYEICPYFKFAHLSANGAIAEAMKYEDRIHIIDFQISQGSQWFSLIQALSARPGGPPHVRITGIDDSISAYARGGGLHIVGRRLSKLAASCNVPFEFNSASVSGSESEIVHLLKVLPAEEEALAVNFALTLHHMPDESVGGGTENRRDKLLRSVRGLRPAVVTLVEQESNTNTAPFLPRFAETMNYYSAVFESIDVTCGRDDRERISVEQHCLARDIVNIIACEGAERVERHELLRKWRCRFGMAGFVQCPLSGSVNATIKELLESYCEMYRLEERDGALFLGWKDRAIVASCAFKPSVDAM